MTNFLPVTMQELLETGVSQPDFVYITGDAYVDHPSFGAAIITRLLQSQGYSVAVLAQPDWHTVKDFTRFGKPRLAFLVTGGNIDSMVAHYTSAKRKRSTDMYSPAAGPGFVPTVPSSPTAGKFGRLTPMPPLPLADWKLLCGGSPTMTTGTTPSARPFWQTAEQIC